jgi:hypothetical protein
MTKRFLAYTTLLIIAIFTALPCLASLQIGLDKTANIAAVSTTLTFTQPGGGAGLYSHVIIKTSTNAAIVYVNINNGTATATDFQIDPGGSLALGCGVDTMSPMSGFTYLGASATGTISYVCW